jgi:putrescine transport system substrate-binding protein
VSRAGKQAPHLRRTPGLLDDARMIVAGFVGARWWLAFVASLIAACSGSSNSLPPASDAAADAASSGARAGDQDNVLNVYNWSDFIGPSIVADFEKESGIKVHYDVYETNEMMEVKLLSGHTNYDIVVPGGSFFEREVKAGIYRRLDKSLLPGLKNLDPGAVSATAVYDPGNQYGVDYTWLISVGMGYDVNKVKARVADAPVDSWRLIFDPKVLSKMQDCGVSVLDSPDDVVGSVLAYLGKDPNSESPEDLASAEKVLQSIRGYIRYVDSTRYVADLANGDLCLALGWSGDVALARRRASEAGNPVTIGYSVPREGALSIVDVIAIPADAPHPKNAYRFIDYLLRPDVAAKNTMAMSYASGVAGSTALVSESLRNDSAVYPPPAARARLVPMRARSQQFTRSLMRMWTRFKTGQ